MNIAYVRISGQEKNFEKQFDILKQYNIEKTFKEKTYGKYSDRPQLKTMIDFADDGDTIYIENISRIARNTRDFLNIINKLAIKNIYLVSLKENINTTPPQGSNLISAFKALSELDRYTTKQNQAAGIALNRAQHKPYGRPKIEIDEKFHSIYKRWRAKEITAVEAMKLTGLKKNTFYNRVKDYEKSIASGVLF